MARARKYKTEAEKREVRRQRERIRRANETPLERDQRLMKLSLNEWKRRRSETAEERSDRLKRLSFNARKRRAKETAEERANRLRKLSESEMRRRARETDDERKIRLQKLAEYAKNKRNSMTNSNKVRKVTRNQKPTTNDIKIDLTDSLADQNLYLEQVPHDPEKFQALVENTRLSPPPSSQLRCTETKKLPKVSVRNRGNLKQKTQPKKTSAQKDQSNEASSKLSKNNKYTMYHSVSSEILPRSQSAAHPSQEKHILVVPNHQTAVMSNLFSMWKAGHLCDSYISNGTTNIMVHKMVLGAVCPKLLQVLNHSPTSFPKVVFPCSVSREGLLAFVEYMYIGVLDLNEDILGQMMTIAEKLDIKDFEELCCKELKKVKAKNILSAIVEPLLAEPCSMSGLFHSKAQGDSNDSQDSIRKLFENDSTSNNLQTDAVTTSTSTPNTSTFDISLLENVIDDQIVDIKTEVEPEGRPLQLKMEESDSLVENEWRKCIRKKLTEDVDTSDNDVDIDINDISLDSAVSVTSSNNINKENELMVKYSKNQHKNYANKDTSNIITILNTEDEETCLSGIKDSNKDTDNQKEIQLIAVTSSTSNINEDSHSNDSDLIEISYTISTNSKPPQL